MHPEKLVTQQAARRWVFNGDELPAGFAPGRLINCPGPLGTLMEGGVITEAIAEASALWLWLREGESWRDRGAQIRDAMTASLQLSSPWYFAPVDADVVERIAHEVLSGRVGDFITSHGGEIALGAVRADAVDVRFGGVCASCSALWITLGSKVRVGVQERLPDVAVTAEGVWC